MSNNQERSLADILVEYVHLTPGDSFKPLKSLAKSFIKNDVLQDEIYLGGQTDLKETIKRGLKRKNARLNEEVVLKSISDSRNELDEILRNKSRQHANIFRTVLVLPLFGIVLIAALASENQIATSVFWMISMLIIVVETVLFYCFFISRKELIVQETEVFRLKILEARLQMIREISDPAMKATLCQIVSQNLVSDQQSANQMIVYNWGNIGKMINVSRLEGNVNINEPEVSEY